MSWRMWCCVLLVTVVLMTRGGEAWPGGLHQSGGSCSSDSVGSPCYVVKTRAERAAGQATEDVEKEEHTQSPQERKAITSARGEGLLPRSDQCGERSRKSYRVTFGEDAPLAAYPWIAMLGYRNASHPTWKCGGTLINNRYVVTAAHCVHPIHADDDPSVGPVLKIRLGEHNLLSEPDCPEDYIDSQSCSPYHQDYLVEDVTCHEEYNSESLQHDIALIRLASPVTFGPSIKPVCLPPPDLDVKEFLGSRDAMVAGWGTTENNTKSKILQRAPIPFADKDACKELYTLKLIEGQICLGGRGKVDSCYGDSGGPAMQAKLGSPRFTLLGIVSYGKRTCGIPGTPAIYTNVAYYMDWIWNNLKP